MANKCELTEAQRRRLEIALSRLVLETRELASELPTDGEAAAVGPALQEIGEAALRLGAELGLELSPPPKDWQRHLQAWASAWWAELLDCRAERLQAYGEVDPNLAPILDDQVQELASRLLRLSRSDVRRRT